MDNGFKEELEKLDLETELYWKQFDKECENIDWDKIQTNQKNMFAEMLKGDLGKDIMDVTSGKVKVKLSFGQKIRYWFEKLFKLFS